MVLSPSAEPPPLKPDNTPDERRKKSRRRRRTVWALALLALAVLLPVLIVAALGLEAVRDSIAGEVAQRLQARTGLGLEVSDWHVEWRKLALRLEGPRLLSPEGEELFTAKSVRVDLRGLPLLGRRLVVEQCVLEAPWIDLAALPSDSAGDGEEETAWSFEVLSLMAVDAGVLLPKVAGLEGLVDTWRAEAISLSGSVGPPHLALDLSQARLLARGPRLEEIVLEVKAEIAGELGESLTLNHLQVRGNGLRIEATGLLGLTEKAPLELDFDFEADAHRLLPKFMASVPAPLPGQGHARGHGRLDLRTLQGVVQVDVDGFPAEVLQPLLGAAGPEVFARLRSEPTFLDLEARTRIGPSFEPQVEATLEASWYSANRSLVEGRLDASGDLLQSGRIDLPSLAGKLRLATRDLPSEVVATWISSGDAGRAAVFGTTLDADVFVAVDPADSRVVQGTSSLVLRRRERPLVEATARLTRGALDESGRLALDSLAAAVDVRARDLSPTLAEAWIGSEWLERLAARDTLLGLAATFEVDLGTRHLVAGTAEVEWRRGERTLLRASARSDTPISKRHPFAAHLSAQLLPASAGRRSVGGEIVVADWARPMETQVRAGRLDLEVEDLETALAEVRDLWPLWTEPRLEERPVRGSLDASIGFDGRLRAPEVEARVTWRPAAASVVEATAQGSLALQDRGRFPDWNGSVELRSENLDLDLFGAGVRGILDLEGSARGTLDEYQARLSITAHGLGGAETEHLIDRFEAVLETDGRVLDIVSLAGRSAKTRFSGRGDLDFELPPTRLNLALRVDDPVEGIEGLELTAELEDRILRLHATELRTSAGDGTLEVELPLGVIRSVEKVAARLPTWWPEAASGEGVKVRARIPRLDAASLTDLFSGEPGETQLELEAIELDVELDPDDLARSRGRLGIERLTTRREGVEVRNEDPVRVDLGSGELRLHKVKLLTRQLGFEVGGSVGLVGGWRPGDPPADLLGTLALEARGETDLALLNPLLAGGSARGPVRLQASLAGPLAELSGRVTLEGQEASLSYLSPYMTRLEEIYLDAEVKSGVVTIRRGRARFNEGSLALTGWLRPNEELVLEGRVDQVRYRLDYGLSAVLSGDLRYLLRLSEEAAGSSLLSGSLVMERGLMRRNLDLDRELLLALLAPAEIEDSRGEELELDLTLATREGVRVRNNVADLRALWSPLRIRGTLAEPRLQGRIEAEPGGMIYAYGQTVRLDEASLTFSGQPGAEPQLDLITTSSLQDPSLETGGRRDLFARPAPPWEGEKDAGAGLRSSLTGGLASHYGQRLASTVGEAVGVSSLTLRPVEVLGESDPDGHLSVGADANRNLTLAMSLDLKSVERRTYLLEVHELKALPGLVAQLFTNESTNDGVALQHAIELGGSRHERDLPVVRTVRFQLPEGVSRRRMRRAIEVERGDVVRDGMLFDVEVAITELMRRRGYPGAGVEVAAVPQGRRGARDRVAVEIDVDPGPQVHYRWSGENLPGALRQSIVSLYRTDFYEPASIEEMRQQTVRALYSLGFLQPSVEITVRHGDQEYPPAPHQVLIHTVGGRRVTLGDLELPGLPEDVASVLQQAFPSTLSRVELAGGIQGADRRLRKQLSDLGYTEARIAGRSLSPDGKRLRVTIEPGVRRQVARVEIVGLDESEGSRLLPQLSVAPGDPLLVPNLTRSSLALESDLRRRGFTDVRVRTSLTETETPTSLDVVFTVEPGPPYRVGAVKVTGAPATRPKFAVHVSQLDEGESLDPAALDRARRELLGLGTFSTVYLESERAADGSSTVILDLREKPRFTLGYGLRWESDRGGALVLDALDRNLGGRGIGLGARLLVASEDRLGRLYSVVPRLFGSRFALEGFVESGRLTSGGFITDTTQGSLQLSRLLVPRLTGRFYVRQLRERVREEEPNEFFPIDETTTNPSLGIQLVYEGRARPVVGSTGLFLSGDLSGSSDRLGSDFEYLRFLGQANYTRPIARLGTEPLVWAQSWRLGLADAFGQRLLRPARFFAGGEYSVRGYPTEGLGPIDRLDDQVFVLGGEALLVVNQELRLPVWGPLSAVAFLDVGGVWDSTREVGSDLVKSAGLGIRGASPIGLLRADFAWPLDRRQGDPPYKVYVGLGHVF